MAMLHSPLKPKMNKRIKKKIEKRMGFRTHRMWNIYKHMHSGWNYIALIRGAGIMDRVCRDILSVQSMENAGNELIDVCARDREFRRNCPND